MSLSHLQTNVHYRVSITTPTGEIAAAHVQWRGNDDLSVAYFLKDEDRADEAVEVLDQLIAFFQRDADGTLRKGSDSFYLWDWDEARWAAALSLETPPTWEKRWPF